MNRILLIVLTILGFQKSLSQEIVATPIEINYTGSSYPKDLVQVNNKLFFTATESVSGRELWVHELDTKKTYLVKDINDGYNAGIEDGTLTRVGDIVYFAGNQFGYNVSLFKSDGTKDGTILIKTINPGSPFNPQIKNLTNFNGKLFFTTNDSIHGNELWVSDGTATGTMLLKDINPGVAGSNPQNLFVFKNNLYFTAYDAVHGTEIWKSDGTANGTILLKDINPSTNVAASDKMIILNDRFYFFANDGFNGKELWSSDGTLEGTSLVKDIIPGIDGITNTFEGTAANGFIIFNVTTPTNNSQLWKSDGTSDGTTIINDVPYVNGNYNSDFVYMNGWVYYTIGYSTSKKKIWKTNGTTEATQEVINFTEQNLNIFKLTAVNDFLMFSAGNNSITHNPWVSHGTTESTYKLNNLDLRVNSSAELNFTPVNNKVFFQASSGEESGMELWDTDGTAENTEIVKDISHNYSGFVLGGSVSTLNDKLIFIGNDGVHHDELYISNGTKSGTKMVKDINPQYSGVIKSNLIKAGNKIYFNGNDGMHGSEIFSTDGTEEGTVLVKDIVIGTEGSINENTFFMEYNGVFYFKANDKIHGEELWRTDGTEQGTYILKDIYPGALSGITSSNDSNITPNGYAILNGFLYFTARDASGYGIWKTDGTEQGTAKVLANGQNGSAILNATDEKLFFVTNNTNSTYGYNTLWSSDGTQNGTAFIGTYNESSSTQFRKSCVIGNILYFGVFNNQTGLSLMKSDGTPTGTSVVKGGLDDGFTNFQYLDSCGDYVYFVMGTITGSESGHQLWRSDGTEEGTIIIADDTTPDFFAVANFTCVKDNLFYTSSYSSNYIWQTNGDPANKRPIEIIVNNDEDYGDYFGIDGIVGVVNDIIYLSRSTPIAGTELYAGILDESILGIKNSSTQNTTKYNFIIYPNPGSDIITVSSKNNTTVKLIEVFDITGKKVMNTEANSDSAEINISGLLQGVYIVKIHSANSIETKKIIKK